MAVHKPYHKMIVVMRKSAAGVASGARPFDRRMIRVAPLLLRDRQDEIRKVRPLPEDLEPASYHARGVDLYLMGKSELPAPLS